MAGFKFKSAIVGSREIDSSNIVDIIRNISFQKCMATGQSHQVWKCDPRSVQPRKQDGE